jgi:hypothetical protein
LTRESPVPLNVPEYLSSDVWLMVRVALDAPKERTLPVVPVSEPMAVSYTHLTLPTN